MTEGHKIGDGYYCFPVAGTPDSFYITEKNFWDEHGYIDETEEANELIHNIPGFQPCMESCICPINDLSPIEAENLLKSYGFTPLEEQD